MRYEKGNFKTGACLLQNSKVIVINRFSNLESKILAIVDLARELEMDYTLLDEKQVAKHRRYLGWRATEIETTRICSKRSSRGEWRTAIAWALSIHGRQLPCNVPVISQECAGFLTRIGQATKLAIEADVCVSAIRTTFCVRRKLFANHQRL